MAISKMDSSVDLEVAKRPTDMEAVARLLEEITRGVQALTTGAKVNRRELVLRCRSLAQAMETPRETMLRHTCADPGALGALSFGVDSGLWALMAKNGDGPQKVADLAAKLGVNPVLLTMGHIVETGEDEYKTTNFAKAVSLPLLGNGYLAMQTRPLTWAFVPKGTARVPESCVSTNSPEGGMEKPDRCQGHGHDVRLRHRHGHVCLGQRPWMDPSIYPVHDRLIDGADESPEAPFLVDIGGCMGEVLGDFKRRHPEAPGKLILQDLPEVVDQAKGLEKTITAMAYDFHDLQPVKAARAYYLRYILHDWPDHVCESILSRVKEAMKPGYSRLLINEHVIPPTGSRWEATGLDMVMLAVFSSKERTLHNWRDLLEARLGSGSSRFGTAIGACPA
ncbi:hypothetical protein HIM_07308 [Hirsutella minnesotensis 3608]|uniref:O-methyltransferase C-terminal domain-containing protein n=1 Tax=Hirsutella minnesotensis 3608 TaxID=1043627 RepID=A0A0F8A4B8_9HYPO|nr:hypothetical protein HIM_07308 [Hirsutella minnesotensis 3608]